MPIKHVTYRNEAYPVNDDGQRVVLFAVPLTVGPCSEKTEPWAETVGAHAHYNLGIICAKDEANAASGTLMLHELAHLVAPQDDHGFYWKRAMKAMGQPIEDRYNSRILRCIGSLWKRG